MEKQSPCVFLVLYSLPDKDFESAGVFTSGKSGKKSKSLSEHLYYSSNYSDWNVFCPGLAVLRGSGRNADNDFWKDYEQPLDTEFGYCVTAFFYTWAKAKGGTRPSSDTVDPSYGDNLFRRRVIIGMSGMPDFFAHAQVALILY